MKRHKWEWQGPYRRPLVMERDFFRAAPGGALAMETLNHSECSLRRVRAVEEGEGAPMKRPLQLIGGPQDGLTFFGDPSVVQVRVVTAEPQPGVHVYVRGTAATYSYKSSEPVDGTANGPTEVRP